MITETYEIELLHETAVKIYSEGSILITRGKEYYIVEIGEFVMHSHEGPVHKVKLRPFLGIYDILDADTIE